MAGAIYVQLAKVMGEVGAVGKTRKNPQQGYQFRGIDDVMAHVQDLLAKHCVVVVPRVVEREREMLDTKSGGKMSSVRLLVDHTFYAEDGSSVVCTTLGEAMDSGDKASNKAMSAALKYALTQTLMIPTYEAERDTEEASPVVAGKGADDVDRETLALHAAFARASTTAELDALWPRVKALPVDVVARLTVEFRARKAQLK